MNRILAGGLGMMLGLLASVGRADDNVNWHAPRANPGADAAGSILPVRRDDPPAARPALPAPKDLLPPAATVDPPAGAIVRPIPPVNSYHMPATADRPTGEPWIAAAADGGRRSSRLEVTGEYLLWWSRRPNQGPPLLTTSPPNGTNGVPGAVPGSTVLLSAGDLGGTFRDGARFGMTFWLDECQTHGFDGRIFFTGNRKDTFQATSDQFPNGLFRPFFIANPVVPGGPPVGEFREVVTAPGVTSGQFTAENRSQFWGAEANYRDNLCQTCACCGPVWRADVFAGFRYLNLNESLQMTEDVTRLAASPLFPDEVAGTHIINSERFATFNNFYGGQIGTVLGYRNNRWTADLRAAVALGVTTERLEINGAQARVIPGGPTLVFPGGLFALPSNIGTFNRSVFAVAPEVGLNVGYQVTDHLRAFVGYNFLYWSNVIRPGDQIDRVLDVNQIPRFVNLPPGTIPAVFPPRPAVNFNETDFWAQGVNFGMEFRW